MPDAKLGAPLSLPDGGPQVDKFLDFSEYPFLHVQNGNNNSSYGILMRLKMTHALTCVLAHYQAHS